jgi:hypothetical protein
MGASKTTRSLFASPHFTAGFAELRSRSPKHELEMHTKLETNFHLNLIISTTIALTIVPHQEKQKLTLLY